MTLSDDSATAKPTINSLYGMVWYGMVWYGMYFFLLKIQIILLYTRHVLDTYMVLCRLLDEKALLGLKHIQVVCYPFAVSE